MRMKAPPRCLQSPTSSAPCITFGKPKFVPLAGIPIQGWKEKYKPPRPPSLINLYIPVYHDNEVAYQLQVRPEDARFPMCNYPLSPARARTEGLEQQREDSAEEIATTGQRSKQNFARPTSPLTPPTSPSTSLSSRGRSGQPCQELPSNERDIKSEQPIQEQPEIQSKFKLELIVPALPEIQSELEWRWPEVPGFDPAIEMETLFQRLPEFQSEIEWEQDLAEIEEEIEGVQPNQELPEIQPEIDWELLPQELPEVQPKLKLRQLIQKLSEILPEFEWEQYFPQLPEIQQEIELEQIFQERLEMKIEIEGLLSSTRRPRRPRKPPEQDCLAIQEIEVLSSFDGLFNDTHSIQKHCHKSRRKSHQSPLELAGGPYNARRRARALQMINIVPSPEIPENGFDFLRLPTELRLLVYDMIVTSQTFMVTSQIARGSTCTNLAYTCKKVKGEMEFWARDRSDLTLGLRGGFVDFKNTTFLVDYWKDRLITRPTVIHSRFQHISKEKTCAEQMRDLCMDIRTASGPNGRIAVVEFIRSMYDTVHRFIRLQKLTIIYDSGDENMSDWYLQKGLGWKGQYETKEGFLRTVWRMLPSALGVCHWSQPCTCCAASWRIELRGFDVRLSHWVELPLEREIYTFAMAS